MPAVIRSNTVAPVVATTPKAIDFTRFSPTGVTRLRDGGSIIVKGNLNRSVTADVRLDGALNSPTRGKFFVTSRLWNQGPGPDRPATKAELKQLKASLTDYLSRVRLDRPTGQTYDTLMRRLDAAIAAPTVEPMAMPKYLKLLSSTVFDRTGWPADLSRFPAVAANKLPPAVKRAGEAWANREEGVIEGGRRIDLGGRTAYVVNIEIPNDAETSFTTFKVFDTHGHALPVKPPR